MGSHKYLWCIMPIVPIQKELVLTTLSWKDHKSDGVAGLMVYIAILFGIDGRPPENDGHISGRFTYSYLEDVTLLSRAKIAKGLAVLEAKSLLLRESLPSGNNYFIKVQRGGWGKLPRQFLLNDSGECKPFKKFNLRSKDELNMLKLYLLLLTFRDNKSNTASIGYDKIEGYTGIFRGEIKKAVSQLIAHNMITVDCAANANDDTAYHGTHNMYKIRGLS